jgi:hypothetical protein
MVLTVVIVLVALGLIYLTLAYFVAGSIIHLNRQPVPKKPADYGMEFENIEFTADDGVKIRGWLIPGAENKLIIMTHVGGLTRYGSTVTYKNPTSTIKR